MALQKFYDKLEKVYVYFSSSTARWQGINSCSTNNECITKTLKNCPTRWSSKYDSLLAIKNNFKSISQFLSQGIFMSKKSSERNEALGLRKQLENFEFILSFVSK